MRSRGKTGKAAEEMIGTRLLQVNSARSDAASNVNKKWAAL
jgi:hypothetical protein